MKVKQTILALSSLVVAILGMATAPALTYAASCGGVETSIISCDNQKGPCPNGPANPYEGSNPGTDKDRKAEYQAAHGHEYGKCNDGSAPNDAVNSSGIWGILLMVLNIMTAGVGILAVAGVVYATILYTTAADRPEQIKKAKELILNVVIGIVAFGLMYSFLNYLIPGGIFT